MSSLRYVYPEELRGKPRPMICFECHKTNGDGSFISFFPIPTGISFDDGASYNETELGLSGAVGLAMTNNASSALEKASGEGLKSQLMALGGSAVGSIAGMAGKVTGRDAVVYGANTFITDQGAKAGVAIAMGTTLNKNVTTEFTGVGTRNYKFAFKFISRSAAEAQQIKEIVEGFRANLYPVGNYITLKYPPKWRIRFLLGDSGDEIAYIPRIFECYLKNVSSSYNNDANIWHRDGSPLQTEISLDFIETRALTYDDIKQLEKETYKPADFVRNISGAGETAKSIAEETKKEEAANSDKNEKAAPANKAMGATNFTFKFGAS